MIYKNIFYFKGICAIGGTENFLWQIAQKYRDMDITIFYDSADSYQLYRLRKYVRCCKHIKGQKVVCERAFFNFNIDMIDDVESTENYYAFVSHANFEELGYKPPIEHPKLNHFFGVSPFACRKLETYALRYFDKKIKCKLTFNPLVVEPKQEVIHLVSACRLDDKVKGGGRTLQLIKALDDYCVAHNTHYIWHIFTNQFGCPTIKSKNVCLMKPRVEVIPYIQDADYVLQLSNDMETYCYTINEAWSYGVHTITTPLSVLADLPIPKQANTILEYDCSNIDEVVKRIFEKKREPFKYKAPNDNWGNILAVGKSTYEKGNDMRIILKQQTFDTATGKMLAKGTILDVDDERGLKCINNGWAEEIVIEKKVEQPKVEKNKTEVKVETKKVDDVKKAIKKTSPKNK